jgi:hypothetical protein
MINSETTRPNASAPLTFALRVCARSALCSPGSYTVDSLDHEQQDGEQRDSDENGCDVHEVTMQRLSSRSHDDLDVGRNDCVTDVRRGRVVALGELVEVPLYGTSPCMD